MKNKTKGHGYFRKNKAYGLVCGIALTGALVFAGQTHADEITTPTDTTAATELVKQTQGAPAVATQPASTNDNDAYAKQANTSMGTETVAVDNSAVESAVKTAQDTGVAVSQDATQDQGTPTTSSKLDTAKEAIKADQDKQVEAIKATTAQQAQNNTAYESAQSAITANNTYVADAQKTYEADTTVSVTTNTATATDGTAKANNEAKKVADSTLDSNKKAVETYVADKKTYDAIVAQATTLNQAVEAAVTELKNKGVSVTTTTKVVTSVEAVKTLQAQNDAAIATDHQAETLNTALLAAYDKAKTSYQQLEKQVSTAQTQYGSALTVNTVTTNSGDGTHATEYQDYSAALEALLTQNSQALATYAQALADYQKATQVSVSASVATQNVDNQTYGDSIMSGQVNADGTFSFTHDINDGDNATSGVLGTGTLTGKLNYTTKANGDGSITVTLTSMELYSYAYTSNRANHAVNQNLNFHVYTLGGTEIYSTHHNGNSSFTNTINRSITLDASYTIRPNQSTGNIGILNIDDNWVYNTHGQAIFNFTNNNQAPTVTLQKTTAPVAPSTTTVSVELVKADNPEKPTLHLTKLADTKNQQLKASYHNYSLHYKPVVSKSVADTDNANTNGKTVAKGDTEVYTLTHDNIYANIKVGDPITITDPLETGVIPAEKENLADNTAKGWTVAYDKAKNTYTFTATYQGKKLAAPTIKWKGEYDNAYYDNTYKVTVGNNTYTVFSNTVNNRTPEPPKPVKSITDNSGADINGASVIDKNVNFHLATNYRPYTSLSASQAAIAKGFAILDDVQDGAFTVNEDNITMTADNKDVKDLFTMYHVLSDKDRTEAIQKILDASGLSPVGEFYLWAAKDPSSFYENYVKQAKNVTINLPARLNVDPGVKVYNDFFQIDFGNSYQSNQVVVERPDIQPEKHALDKADDSIVLDNQTVQIGDYIRYLLDGVTVPVKHDTLWQYDGVDQLDTVHDRYTGNWKGVIKGTEYTAKEDLVLPYDVTLEDGTVVKAGDTIKAGSKYAFRFEFNQDTNDDFINKMVKVTWDAKTGKWAYSIDKEFLNSLGIEGTFDADFYLEVERIATGDVTNTFVNIVNGQEMEAKVMTHTPEKPKTPTPENPTPAQPQTQAPVAKQAVLPTTGESGSALAVLGGLLLAGLGLIGIRKRQEN